jgi:hypothetical protein
LSWFWQVEQGGLYGNYSGCKGSSKAKQFVVQLIPPFFKYSLSLFMQAINVQLDLCEEDELGVVSITSMG